MIPVLFFTFCSSPVKQSEDIMKGKLQDTAVADSMPSFTVIDVEGRRIDLASLRGKKVFVNLWATWCGPCKREIPSIEQLYSKVDKSKAAFVLLSLDKDFLLARKYASSQFMNAPIYYPAETLPGIFSVDGIPTTFIFDENGKLLKRIDGADDYDTMKYAELLN